jgi:hypothetical protein
LLLSDILAIQVYVPEKLDELFAVLAHDFRVWTGSIGVDNVDFDGGFLALG